MSLHIKPANTCAFDQISLGEVMLRLDPGEGRIRTAREFKVWEGGMSFHGGLLGVLISFYFFARRHTVRWLALMDLLAAATPVGLFLGRLANFVNGELYGRVTTSSWGMVFPGGGPVARYPSQLFEATLEGFTLFFILFFIAKGRLSFTARYSHEAAYRMGWGICSP